MRTTMRASTQKVFFVPATSHYSWPKAATLLGLGQNAALVQRVDMDARLDGGIMGGLKRAVAGQSLFLTFFRCSAPSGKVAFSAGAPGETPGMDRGVAPPAP